MSGLNRQAFKFLDSYEHEYEEIQAAAELARNCVAEIVQNTGTLVHVITGRAKTPESVRGKLRRRHYRRPDRQVTDMIGVRVITYYRDDVDPVVRRLKKDLKIDKKESVDKRGELGLRDFGYRSVHLIARLKSSQAREPRYQILRDRWFEIQVRSVLEHAWAEIEHHIVYKAGIEHPEDIVRRFASLAGTLELLDREFLALRDQRNNLIERYVQTYIRSKDQRKTFDVARLQGFLEAFRPKGLSWRQAADSGVPFDVGLDVSCSEALKAVGLGTPASLGNLFKSRQFSNAISSFAALQGIAPETVSHLAVVVLAVIVKNVKMVQLHFPEIVYDSAIKLLIQKRLQR